MADNKVYEIQVALRDAGFYDDKLDGIFGPKTFNSVKRFQEVNRLIIDGEVGAQTATALGIKL